MSSTSTILAKGLESTIFEANSEVYEAFLKSYFIIQETQLRPLLIFAPISAQDVSQILTTVRSLNTETEIAIKVAIRGGVTAHLREAQMLIMVLRSICETLMLLK